MNKNLNLENMQEALKYIEGEHDFSSFRSVGGNDTSPVRENYMKRVASRNAIFSSLILGQWLFISHG